jgi:hypothetical protein
MTSAEIRRKKDVSWSEVPEESIVSFNRLYSLDASLANEVKIIGPTVKAEKDIQDNTITNGLNALTGYIPTETLTLYVAAISASSALTQISSYINDKSLFWFFAIFTPIVIYLVYHGKSKKAGLSLPKTDLPLWKMSAGFVAFLVWALAIPNNPYIHGEVAGIAAGFLALFCSTVLTLLEPLFGQE